MFRDSLAASVEPVAGIHALLDWAEADGAGCAVVTNAPRDNAVAMLAAASLAHRLPTLVIGDECARPKPDPAPYRAAMRALGVTPSRAVAFEDSALGPARRARLRRLCLRPRRPASPARRCSPAGAHAVIADFTDPALWAHLDRAQGPRRMTRTIVESKSKTVIIGFDQPFCVIGERINPTGRKLLAAELEAGSFATVEKDALRAGRLRRHHARCQRRASSTTRTPTPTRPSRR